MRPMVVFPRECGGFRRRRCSSSSDHYTGGEAVGRAVGVVQGSGESVNTAGSGAAKVMASFWALTYRVYNPPLIVHKHKKGCKLW